MKELDMGLSKRATSLFQEHTGLNFKIEVYWNSSMKSNAGLAFLTSNRVELNVKLKKEGVQAIKNTFLHEVAHLIAYRTDEDRGHGKPWREACRKLGIFPNRCHSYESMRRKPRFKKYHYECSICGFSYDAAKKFRKAKMHTEDGGSMVLTAINKK